MKNIGSLRPVSQDTDILQPGGTVYTPTNVHVPEPATTPIVTPVVKPIVTTGVTTIPTTQGPYKDDLGNTYWIVNGTKTYYNPTGTIPVVPVTPSTPVIPETPVTPVTKNPIQPIIPPDTTPATTQNTTDMQTIDNTQPVNIPYTASNPIDGYTYCCLENSTYDFGSNIVDVAFGENGLFNFLKNVTGKITFNVVTFGDPDFGVKKKGYYKIVTPAAQLDSTNNQPVTVSPTQATTQPATLQEAPVTTDSNGNVIPTETADTTTTTSTPVTTPTPTPTINSKWLWIGGGVIALWWLLKK